MFFPTAKVKCPHYGGQYNSESVVAEPATFTQDGLGGLGNFGSPKISPAVRGLTSHLHGCFGS